MIIQKPYEELGIREAAEKVVQVYQEIINDVKTGTKIAHIDTMIMKVLDKLKCKSCFHKYRIPGNPPFPSYSCLSVNNCIIHGTAGYYEAPLKPGDLLKIDIGVSYKGWIGDAAWTFCIKDYPSQQAKKLMECGKISLKEGIEVLQAGKRVSEWAHKIQPIIGKYGFHICKNIGGHGYGRKLHEAPHISNTISTPDQPSLDDHIILQDGMVIAVEPMIAIGTPEIIWKSGYWPVMTKDGSLSVHYEADILIKNNNPENMTIKMFDLPDLLG